MINKTINNIKSDLEFMLFIQKNFMKPIEIKKFPIGYMQKRISDTDLKKLPQAEQEKIIERNLIRDNIFNKYKFDIFEYPFAVFFEEGTMKKLKKFKLEKEAHNFSDSLIKKGIFSILIKMMNYDIECEIYR